MQTAANSSLFPTNFSSLKRFADSKKAISHDGFYQLIASELVGGLHTKQVLNDLGERLVVLAERAHSFRRMDTLTQVGQILTSTPFSRQYQAIGRYYQAVCIQRFGRGDVERAMRMLERVAENAPPRYRVRAMISLAANLRHQYDNQSALSLYSEAARFARCSEIHDPYVILGTQRMPAVINSEDGNHRDALELLENLFPLAQAMRSTRSHVYYDYMNSLAVELGEAGRLDEAKSVSQIVLASPFAAAYPEWRETRDEIQLRGRRASRAIVAFGPRTSEAEDFVRLGLCADSSETVSPLGNVVSLPVRAPDGRDSADPAEPIPGDLIRSARVFNLEDHKKKKMSEKPNDEPKGRHTQAELNKMTTSELLVAIMNRISGEIGDDALAKVLSLLDEIALENKKKT